MEKALCTFSQKQIEVSNLSLESPLALAYSIAVDSSVGSG